MITLKNIIMIKIQERIPSILMTLNFSPIPNAP